VSESNETNRYVIVPWDHLIETQSPDGSVHDQFVPPELEELARRVMRSYDMTVSSMRLITAKPDKGGAIWRIETNHGPRSIKVLHRTPNRSLFSIGAQDYLVRQGARVPALIPTTDGELYVVAGGKAWIVTEWIEPLTPVSKIDLQGVRELCRGLGEFHRLSRGYTPPFGAVKASRLYRWAQHYEKIMMKLSWFAEIAEVYSEFPAANTLSSMLPQIRSEASDHYMMFRDSAYDRMAAMGEPYWGLAHQDYGWSNGQKGPGGIWIIDLDGVAYDIPIRDLRKLITSTMVDNGGWDINWVRGMIEAYNEGNPIDRETFELLWIDMAFPNEFYKHVKEIVYDPERFMATELEPILRLMQTVDLNKWDVLSELKKDMNRYPSGEYPAAEAEAAFFMPIEPLLGAAAALGSAVPSVLEPLPGPSEAEFAAAGPYADVLLQEAAAGREYAETAPVPAEPFIALREVAAGRAVRRRRRLRRRAAGRRASGRMSAASANSRSDRTARRTQAGNRAVQNSRAGNGRARAAGTRAGARRTGAGTSGRNATSGRQRTAAGRRMRVSRNVGPVYRSAVMTGSFGSGRRRESLRRR